MGKSIQAYAKLKLYTKHTRTEEPIELLKNDKSICSVYIPGNLLWL